MEMCMVGLVDLCSDDIAGRQPGVGSDTRER